MTFRCRIPTGVIALAEEQLHLDPTRSSSIQSIPSRFVRVNEVDRQHWVKIALPSAASFCCILWQGAIRIAILRQMDRLWTPWRYNYVSRAEPEARKGVPEILAAWPVEYDKRCVFCNLIASTAYAAAEGMSSEDADHAALIVHRGEHCFICLNAFPYATGHVLIVPYQHLDSLLTLPVLAANEMILLAQRTEAVLRGTYHPDGINLGLNLGEAAGAGVADHLHMHALPRWRGDTNFMTVTAETRVLPETLDITWKRLSREFANQATPEADPSSS